MKKEAYLWKTQLSKQAQLLGARYIGRASLGKMNGQLSCTPVTGPLELKATWLIMHAHLRVISVHLLYKLSINITVRNIWKKYCYSSNPLTPLLPTFIRLPSFQFIPYSLCMHYITH